jgi:hypothetical protein
VDIVAERLFCAFLRGGMRREKEDRTIEDEWGIDLNDWLVSRRNVALGSGTD